MLSASSLPLTFSPGSNLPSREEEKEREITSKQTDDVAVEEFPEGNHRSQPAIYRPVLSSRSRSQDLRRYRAFAADMTNEAKFSRSRLRPRLEPCGRGRDRGQFFEAEAETEAKFLMSSCFCLLFFLFYCLCYCLMNKVVFKKTKTH